jgi:1-acyl-sn-glycerol-3-phosphate acyltransferase
MVLRNIIFVPIMWVRLCYHAKHTDKYTEEEHFTLLSWIVRRANRGGNVKIDVHGIDNIPSENGFILFPNHQGLYDALAIIAALPRPFSVINKKEVANVPFLKQVFACMKAHSLDRDDVRQAMKIINDVSTEVANGRNYVIFPEGTRSRKGNVMTDDFKGGSFKAATKAKCPIIPVALIDAFKPFDINSIKPVTVQVHFLKPLFYDDYKDYKTTEIAKIVQGQIQVVLNTN